MTRDQVVSNAMLWTALWFTVAMVLLVLIAVIYEQVRDGRKVGADLDAILDAPEEFSACCPCGWSTEWSQDRRQTEKALEEHMRKTGCR